MALIKCKECGKEISNQTNKCPNCGYPLKKNLIIDNCNTYKKVIKENIKKRKKEIIILFVIVFFISLIFGIIKIQDYTQQKRNDAEIKSLKFVNSMYDMYIKNANKKIDVLESVNLLRSAVGNDDVNKNHISGIIELLRGIKKCNEDIDKFPKIQKQITNYKKDYIDTLKKYDISEEEIEEYIKNDIYSDDTEKNIKSKVKEYLRKEYLN